MSYDRDPDEEEGLRDRELPDESDMDEDDDEGGTDECPWCGQEVYEHAQRCPNCGKYLSEEDAPRRGVPAWVWVGIALALTVVVLWLATR